MFDINSVYYNSGISESNCIGEYNVGDKCMHTNSRNEKVDGQCFAI